jgi:ubiquinone/menaquinone biosynthesis C-methylase UbiE
MLKMFTKRIVLLVAWLFAGLQFESPEVDPVVVEIVSRYSTWGGESERLFVRPGSIIERLRTESILRRYASKPPAVVYDIGGGAGVYAFSLTQQGYKVHLIDLVPLHINQAMQRMKETGITLAECSIGDARHIAAGDGVADIVLLLGPLYHLKEKQDQLQALREAYRILKPGGMLFAVAIPRGGVVLNYMHWDQLRDPVVASMIEQNFKTGISSNPNIGFLSTAYSHNPEEFEEEIKSIGFKEVQLLPDFRTF